MKARGDDFFHAGAGVTAGRYYSLQAANFHRNLPTPQLVGIHMKNAKTGQGGAVPALSNFADGHAIVRWDGEDKLYDSSYGFKFDTAKLWESGIVDHYLYSALDIDANPNKPLDADPATAGIQYDTSNETEDPAKEQTEVHFDLVLPANAP